MIPLTRAILSTLKVVYDDALYKPTNIDVYFSHYVARPAIHSYGGWQN